MNRAKQQKENKMKLFHTCEKSEFSAHISYDGKRKQSVEEHLEGTASKAKSYAETVGLSAIAELAGLLHDIGKFTTEFNTYIHHEGSKSRGEIDHAFAGARFLCRLADDMDEEKYGYTPHQRSPKYYVVSRLIARVISSHHGMHDCIDVDGGTILDKRIELPPASSSRSNKRKNYEETLAYMNAHIDKELLKDMLVKADNELGAIWKKISDIPRSPDTKKSNEELFFYRGLLERFLLSCLIDADRVDTAEFMFNKPNEVSYNNVIWKQMDDNINSKLSSFSSLSDKISKQRMDISERCAENGKSEAFIRQLIVPTGGSKTLSSLRYAIKQCLHQGKRKIIYIAPFMSILEQNSDVIREIAGDSNFTEHYSNVATELADGQELREYELRTEKWDSPVIATTMVQFFNTLFSDRPRRFHRLSDAVIIIDEVQSVPVKCTHIFNLAINFISHILGASVVLCSATQPDYSSISHPLFLDDNPSITGDYNKDFEVFRRTQIVDKCSEFPHGQSIEDVAAFCWERFKEHGNLLVVLNTRSATREMYELLKERCKEDVSITHLSTNMCPYHRRQEIDRVRSLLKEGKPVICVSTQLIEAGVDISFKCVVRSMAGLDNVVQSAGRCNRHGESEGLSPIYVVNISRRDEKTDSIEDIKDSRSALRQILLTNTDNLDSPEVITSYYEQFFDLCKGRLSYPLKKGKLLELLSDNPNARNMMGLTRGNPLDKLFPQAFKKAGSIFAPFDNPDTLDVIVPYNDEAKSLIAELDNERPDAIAFKRAQKYIISVYQNEELKNAIFKLKSGAVALKEGFYQKNIGFSSK